MSIHFITRETESRDTVNILAALLTNTPTPAASTPSNALAATLWRLGLVLLLGTALLSVFAKAYTLTARRRHARSCRVPLDSMIVVLAAVLQLALVLSMGGLMIVLWGVHRGAAVVALVVVLFAVGFAIASRLALLGWKADKSGSPSMPDR